MKTIKELLEPITSTGLSLMVCVDTWEFQKFYESHGSPDGDFHDKIWRPFMSDIFCNGEAYVHFSKEENPKDLCAEWVNKFLDTYPEFEGGVKMIFTN
jgi:hypothetical protein